MSRQTTINQPRPVKLIDVEGLVFQIVFIEYGPGIGASGSMPADTQRSGREPEAMLTLLAALLHHLPLDPGQYRAHAA